MTTLNERATTVHHPSALQAGFVRQLPDPPPPEAWSEAGRLGNAELVEDPDEGQCVDVAAESTRSALWPRLLKVAGLPRTLAGGQPDMGRLPLYGITRGGAGLFRRDALYISGAAHVPPPTWEEVMSGMEDWERWSVSNETAPALLRAVVLHTWLTHIHPFMDGNGRTARAVLNLELIRAGYPSIILRRKDRLRYYEALAESDAGGDLSLIAELVLDRAEDALRDLERAAKTQQGYDHVKERLRDRQARQAGIWNDAVKLLFALVEDGLQQCFGQVGTVKTRWYEDELLLDDYVALAQGDVAGNAWLYRICVDVPGVGKTEFLAWTGFRSARIRESGQLEGGPSIFWSVPDPTGFKRWIREDARSPGHAELTLALPDVDRWIVREADGAVLRVRPSELASEIVAGVEASLGS